MLKSRNEFREDLKDAGWSRCTCDIDAIKLTVTDVSESKPFIEAVSGGWRRAPSPWRRSSASMRNGALSFRAARRFV
ncbi:hypothetical protein [Caballeronia sp. J97]|uniref:hypothetical protein n=1 Tax=Caballeronia sp. J97 TaxID=2805429 RepID=UPI002AB0B7F1|nr:hypothetical protein [Caballeronia sp. J97]